MYGIKLIVALIIGYFFAQAKNVINTGFVSQNVQQNIVLSDTLKDNEPVKFIEVEEKPEFPGGEAELYKFISKKIRYPEKAMKKKIQGTVWIQFIIEKDGSVTNAKVIRSVNPDLDNEALRAIKSMPKWKPGKNKGQLVRVIYELPIKFNLF